ncbi:glycosyltransferase [Brachybacterium avium]|nr:glycosyltransferase [Brachybacterium avium]
MLDHARFLISRSRGSAAEEVLALALARNGALIDALELYFELVRELDIPRARTAWAMDRLRADIDSHPESRRGALDFAIPHRLDDVLSGIGAHGNPVDQTIVQIDRAYEEERFTSASDVPGCRALGENDVIRAHLTAVLGRGLTSTALALLNTADERAVPFNALRRAIRRARGDGDLESAIAYLQAYLRFAPQDDWAHGMLETCRKSEFSNAQLARKGFPLPTKRTSPAVDRRASRVLYFLHNSLPFNSAGYATRSHGLLAALGELGWDVDGVTRLGYPYDLPANAEIPDVPVVESIDDVVYRRLLAGREVEKKNPLYDYTERYSAAIKDLVAIERPAILHAASNHVNGLAAVTAANRLGLPAVYEVRGLWEVTRASRAPEWADSEEFRFLSRMEADAARGATRVIALTAALRDELIVRGVDREKIHVVPNGVDTSRFTPAPRDAALAAQLGLSEKTVIGYVGSIVDYEGLDVLLAAVGSLNRGREDFHVLIVGDGAGLSELQGLVRELELDHVVTFTGRVPHGDVERYYSLIDITPFPRLPLPVTEMVSPLKPFEAMAMGKAVVASDVTALEEFIKPGINGLLHRKGDAESLTAQLAFLLDEPEQLLALGRSAREWVVGHRDWRHIAGLVAEVYADLQRDVTH